LETVWVLGSKSGYNWNRALVLERLRHLMGVPNIYTEDSQNVVKALEWYEQGMDFADALHLSGSIVQEKFATFDKGFINSAQKLQTEVTIEELGDKVKE
jgi:predicted nucleic-acid-binding protein